jgi:hypothetical protein
MIGLTGIAAAIADKPGPNKKHMSRINLDTTFSLDLTIELYQEGHYIFI